MPFIFVSGTIGEERAIEALRQGATDYVLKDNRGRLVPAIRRALTEADERNARRCAEDAQREGARLMNGIIESSLDSSSPSITRAGSSSSIRRPRRCSATRARRRSGGACPS